MIQSVFCHWPYFPMTKKDLQTIIPVVIFVISVLVITPTGFIFNSMRTRIRNNHDDITDLSDKVYQKYMTREEMDRVFERLDILEKRIYEIPR